MTLRLSFVEIALAANELARISGLVPRDMRRSGRVQFRRPGWSEHQGMKLSGHETDSIYRGYGIIRTTT